MDKIEFLEKNQSYWLSFASSGNLYKDFLPGVVHKQLIPITQNVSIDKTIYT